MTWIERMIGNGVWGVALEYLTDTSVPMIGIAYGLAVGASIAFSVWMVARTIQSDQRGRPWRACLNWCLSMAGLGLVFLILAGCSAVPTDGGVYLVDHQAGTFERIER